MRSNVRGAIKQSLLDRTARILGLDDAIVEPIRNHFENRPFRFHLAAWLLIGTFFGGLLAPDYRAISLMAFVFSGVVVCLPLSLITYPLSEHHRMTLVGASGGWLTASAAGFSGAAANPIFAPFGLIVGALVGATCMIWLTGLRKILLPGLGRIVSAIKRRQMDRTAS